MGTTSVNNLIHAQVSATLSGTQRPISNSSSILLACVSSVLQAKELPQSVSRSQLEAIQSVIETALQKSRQSSSDFNEVLQGELHSSTQSQVLCRLWNETLTQFGEPLRQIISAHDETALWTAAQNLVRSQSDFDLGTDFFQRFARNFHWDAAEDTRSTIGLQASEQILHLMHRARGESSYENFMSSGTRDRAAEREVFDAVRCLTIFGGSNRERFSVLTNKGSSFLANRLGAMLGRGKGPEGIALASLMGGFIGFSQGLSQIWYQMRHREFSEIQDQALSIGWQVGKSTLVGIASGVGGALGEQYCSSGVLRFVFTDVLVEVLAAKAADLFGETVHLQEQQLLAGTWASGFGANLLEEGGGSAQSVALHGVTSIGVLGVHALQQIRIPEVNLDFVSRPARAAVALGLAHFLQLDSAFANVLHHAQTQSASHASGWVMAGTLATAAFGMALVKNIPQLGVATAPAPAEYPDIVDVTTGIESHITLKLDRPNVLFPDGIVPESATVNNGRYKILGLIGAGGMGVVFKAYDEVLEREVAIKSPTIEVAKKEEYMARLGREMKVAARFPATLHEMFPVTIHVQEKQEDGEIKEVQREVPILVMDFKDGPNMYQALCETLRRREKIDLVSQDRLNVMVELCNQVHIAHEKGVIHRDLKPANIILGRKEVSLIDWGIAYLRNIKKQFRLKKVVEEVIKAAGKETVAFGPELENEDRPNLTFTDSELSESVLRPELETVAGLTQEGTLIGTVGYMSPEQILDLKRSDPRREDVFSLGVILYEWMTGGLHPFATYNPGLIKRGAPRLLPLFDTENDLILSFDYATNPNFTIPTFTDLLGINHKDQLLMSKYEAVARKAMSADPENRYATALELRDAILLCRAEAALEERRRTRLRIPVETKRMRKIWKSNVDLPMTEDREDVMWEPIHLLRDLRQEWIEKGKEIVIYLINTFPAVKGEDVMPRKGHDMIATIAFQQLEDAGDRITGPEQEALEKQIIQHDLQVVKDPATHIEKIIPGPKSLIVQGAVAPIKFTLKAGKTNQPLDLPNAKIKINSVFPDYNKKVPSTRYTPFEYEGTYSDFQNFDLAKGYYVIEVEAEGYRALKRPFQLSRTQLLEILEGREEFNLDLPLWRNEEVHEDFAIITGGTAHIGRDFFKDEELRAVVTNPHEKISFPSFAISKTPITIAHYKEYIQSIIENINSFLQKSRRDEAMALIFLNDLISHLPRNSELKLNLLKVEEGKANIHSWTEAVTEVEKIMGILQWKLQFSDSGVNLIDPHNTLLPNKEPISNQQPVHSINDEAAQAFARWLSQKHGVNYRLMEAEENEIVSRNGFRWKYPWGYEERFAGVHSRLALEDPSLSYPMPVGTLSRGKDKYKDFSLFGPVDMTGNVRFQTATEAPEKGSVIHAGGGIRTRGGYNSLPESKAYGPKHLAPLYYGAFRLVQDLVSDEEDVEQIEIRDSIVVGA